MNNNTKKPDFIFEVSWEVCNKVGGINTVIATKAQQLSNELNQRYIMIGPDVNKSEHTLSSDIFIEDNSLYRQWVKEAREQGFRFRVGRWNIAGNPIAIVLDFTSLFAKKDEIFRELWENYQLDSIYGSWDYIEPALFGYEAGKLIESFYEYHVSAEDNIAAHFHEWMTGAGILYLKKNVPQIATIFTTHATVLGRSIAGMNLPLYDDLEKYNPDEKAKELNVVAKYSLEKIAAREADAFTTVSDITARECSHFLSKNVDLVTPNGFDDSFVPKDDDFENKRQKARKILRNVCRSVNGFLPSEDCIFVINSGRYEFRNKGIDLFIDSLAQLASKNDIDKDVVAFVTVPANNAGVRQSVLQHFVEGSSNKENEISTHYLFDKENDTILNCIKNKNINTESKVKIIFIPCYLDGNDGLINIPYYDLLIGFDISVFPSYYEPWGYTPLESVAFHIPTITTGLAGFGLWIKNSENYENSGVTVVNRNDYNNQDVVNEIAQTLFEYIKLSDEQKNEKHNAAFQSSRLALWNNLINYYYIAYDKALNKTQERYLSFSKKKIAHDSKNFEFVGNNPNWRKVFVKPSYPENLQKLIELTKNLWWSWNNQALSLFMDINPLYWKKSGNNPIAMLEMLSYDEIVKLSENHDFLARLNSVYSDFEKYMSVPADNSRPSVAYFCMEYGIHASLKLYSGGLGILAGDYLKEASDCNVRMTAIGLLFRYGYFNQKISSFGDQISEYLPQKFSNLPIFPVRNEKGEWRKIILNFPGRNVYAKIWKTMVGRIELYLLDTDIDENDASDRTITHQLYGGDWENRLKQELLLGIGGMKMLNELNMKHDVYHCNEGHAAFMLLERLKSIIQNQVLSFAQALEIVRSSSLFTTHTPVPAGHDSFSEDMIRMYLSHFPEKLNISWSQFYALGKMNVNKTAEKFSMSVLALNASQEVNGVSRIHGRVTRDMFVDLYKGFYSEELYIGYVTNGVHLPTWLSESWKKVFTENGFNIFEANQADEYSWNFIEKLNNDRIWQCRKELKEKLFDLLSDKLSKDLTKRQESPSYIIDVLENLNKDALVFGFARRFATYKRAHLLFKNLDKLKSIVCNEERPVRFVFAGKAHPADKAGQGLIKRIIEVSKMNDFVGKIIFLENYDPEIAKTLVAGVDVWINTPTRPLEASGTSGMKATMNGTLNFSVLDGWWAEGYTPHAGWALKESKTYESQQLQDELDAETIYNIMEDEIIPLYFDKGEKDYSDDWVDCIKKNFTDIAPHFTTKRMIDEYFEKYYSKLALRHKHLEENNFEVSKNLAAWKRKIIRNWNDIEIVDMCLQDSTAKPLLLGEDFVASIKLNIGELYPSDIAIDFIFGQKENDVVKNIIFKTEMKCKSFDNCVAQYECIIANPKSGVFDYCIRMRPNSIELPHLQDFCLVRWL